MRIGRGIPAALCILGLVSCSGPGAVPGGQDAQAVVYEPGAPNFEMEAVASMRGEVPGIDVYVHLPYASLVYLKAGDRFEGGYELVAEVTDPSKAVVVSRDWSDTVRVDTYEETQSLDALVRHERLDLPPGTYTVTLTLHDAETGARMKRSQDVDVFDAGTGDPFMTAVRLLARRDGRPFRPAVGLHVTAGYDSLRAVTHVHNLRAEATVELTLVRYRTDTTIAGPPHWITPAPFSLPYVGVDFERADTLQRTRRPLRDAAGAATIEFALPPLERGSYSVGITLKEPGGADGALASRRFFTVKRPGFPRVTTLDEMVEALVFIASRRELDYVREGATPEERRRRFDAFWAGRIPNRDAAAALLRSYYERVEEANVVFSNFKEGWKTDRGMIYVVMGPPAHTEEHFQRRDWYYYRGMQQLPVFVFDRATPYGTHTLFENYILQRTPRYEEAWQRAVDRWREGMAL